MAKIFENEDFLINEFNYNFIIAHLLTVLQATTSMLDPKNKKEKVAEGSSAPISEPVLQDEEKGYVRHAVDDDGDCGFNAFGITREAAYALLKESLSDPIVRDFIVLTTKEMLLQGDFIDFLHERELLNPEVTREIIEPNLDQYANDLVILAASIDYDIKARRGMGHGWAHPATLQAIAHIQELELRIWHLNEDEQLVPHRDTVSGYDYFTYKHPNATQKIDLLFVQNNHFERLDIFGYEDEPPDAPIAPLDEQSHKPESIIDIMSLEKKCQVEIDCLKQISPKKWSEHLIGTLHTSIQASDMPTLKALFKNVKKKKDTLLEAFKMMWQFHLNSMNALLRGMKQRQVEDMTSHRRWYYWNKKYLKDRESCLINLSREFHMESVVSEEESTRLIFELNENGNRESSQVSAAYINCMQTYRIYQRRNQYRTHAISALESLLHEIARAGEFERLAETYQENLNPLLEVFQENSDIRQALQMVELARENDYQLQGYESQRISLGVKIRMAQEEREARQNFHQRLEELRTIENGNKFLRFFRRIGFMWRHRKALKIGEQLSRWINDHPWKFAGFITLNALLLGASIALPVAAPFLIPIGTAWTVGEVFLVAGAVTAFVTTNVATITLTTGLVGRQVVPLVLSEVERLEQEAQEAEVEAEAAQAKARQALQRLEDLKQEARQNIERSEAQKQERERQKQAGNTRAALAAGKEYLRFEQNGKRLQKETRKAEITAKTAELARDIAAHEAIEARERAIIARRLATDHLAIQALPRGRERDAAERENLEGTLRLIEANQFHQNEQQTQVYRYQAQVVSNNYIESLERNLSIEEALVEHENTISRLAIELLSIESPREDRRNLYGLREAQSGIQDDIFTVVDMLTEAETTVLQEAIDVQRVERQEESHELFEIVRVLKRTIVLLTPNNICDQLIEPDDEDDRSNDPIFLNYVGRNQYAPLMAPPRPENSNINPSIRIVNCVRKSVRERREAIRSEEADLESERRPPEPMHAPPRLTMNIHTTFNSNIAAEASGSGARAILNVVQDAMNTTISNSTR